MTRVFIVDDHDIVREGIKQILSETTDISVTGEARTAAEAIARAQQGGWDVLILDLNLPDRPGLDVLTQIHSIAPQVPILVLSMHSESSYVSRALQTGALGYVSKNNARAHLVAAIRKLARGERFLAPEFAEGVAFDLVDHRGRGRHSRLTDREFQIVCLIAAGRPPRDIAAELNLSVKTVATHRARVLDKLQLRNNAELVQYAIEHDLLQSTGR
jgi:two-component system, NarL family, invasion response regulator UvrY